MFIVGLTGGIGSGKSLVSDTFIELGITVADADIVARKIVEPSTYALQQIVKHFGENILLPDNALNRNKLRNIIFHDNNAKNWLEHLLHPLIEQEQLNIIKNATSPYSLLASPLLIEANQTKYCQRILLVVAQEELKIKRIMKRDKISNKEAHLILKQQLADTERLNFADDVIENNTTFYDVKQQVHHLHVKYLNYAKIVFIDLSS